MSLSHERARFLLDLSLNQELDPADRAALAEHLARCPDCRAAQASLEALDTRLRQALPARRPDYTLSQAEISDRARKISQKFKPKMTAQKLTQLLRPAASFAAILLLVAGLSWIFNSLAPRPVPGQETPPPHRISARLSRWLWKSPKRHRHPTLNRRQQNSLARSPCRSCPTA